MPTSTYTTSKAQAGRGSQLYIGAISGTTTGTETFTLIGEVSTSSITGAQWGTDDVTNCESGNDAEFITTIRNNGSIKIEGNRVPSDAGQIAVEAAFSNGQKYDWKLVLPLSLTQTTTGDTYTFSALCESREIDLATTKKIGWMVTLKVSGPVVLTSGS